MLPGHEQEAFRLFKNAQDDATRVRGLKAQIAEIMVYACSQACSQRGVRLSERQFEELQNMIEQGRDAASVDRW